MSVLDQRRARVAGLFGLAFSLGFGGAPGAEVPFTEKELEDNLSGVFDVFAADIDDDGLLDVVASATTAGDIVWYRNPGGDLTGNWTKFTVESSFTSAISVAAGDIDGDGDTDIIAAGNSSGDITWWENPGNAASGPRWDDHDINLSFSGAISVTLVDLDKDGDLDAVSSSENDGEIVTWLNPGGEDSKDRRLWTEVTIGKTFGGSHEVVVRDVDGDGLVDVLGAASGDGNISWWPNPGPANVADTNKWSEVVVGKAFNGATAADIADINGDGLMDIVATARADGVSWFKNPGGAATREDDWEETFIARTFNGAKNVTAGDIDRDGDHDIVAVAQFDNDVAWFDNPGGEAASTERNWEERTIEGTFLSAVGVIAVDLDGDGDLDIVGAAAEANDVILWINQRPVPPDPVIAGAPVHAFAGGVHMFTFTFPSASGIGYVIEESSDNVNWVRRPGIVVGEDGSTTVAPTSTNKDMYYRVGFAR